ncbi:MAG: hypothetical protein DMG94_09950, partial [Acidobacteria bacterium]
VLAASAFAWRVSRIHIAPLSPELIAELRALPNPAVKSARPAPPPVLTKPAHKKQASKKPGPETPPQPVLESSRVQVEIQHHFTAAKASVWLDDELVFDQELRGADARHPLLRVVEMNQVTSFQFSPGKHYLQVRVVSPANTYDQIETLDAQLEPGSKHVLRVNCDKKKMQVELQ